MRPNPRFARLLLALTSMALAGTLACGGDDGGGTGPSSGNLVVTVAGLPPGTNANVTVTGPNGYSRAVTATTTLQDLAPGTYSAAAIEVDDPQARFTPTATFTQASVSAGGSAAMTVGYQRVTGSLTVTISGLPAGVQAAVRVIRGGGFNQLVTGTITLPKLPIGVYEIEAAAVTGGGGTWHPTPPTNLVNVLASETPAATTVTYAPAPGSLTVTINGMPGSIPADVTVTGPGGYSAHLTATTTLSNLAAGAYAVTAAIVTSGVDVFTPSPVLQNLSLTQGGTAAATVTYASNSGATLNLDVPQAYLVQAVQRPEGTVGLVAGRDALLRVFVRANQANTAQPDVEVTLRDGGTVVGTFTIEAPGASVPTAVSEASFSSSWNLLVSGALIQPGLTLAVEVDPDNDVPEAAESDNGWPVGSASQAVVVSTQPTLEVVFVPVTQDGRTGDVNAGNTASYLDLARRLLPLGTIASYVRVPLATDTVLQANGNGWSQVLGRLQVTKVAENDPRYWYGVASVDYPSGVAGIGYVSGSPVGTSSRVALGWDYSGSRDDVSAHEWGHNFGRLHAPTPNGGGCQTPSGTDPGYPYPNGVTAVYGWDSGTNQVRPPTIHDIMGYCNVQWVSDYTWEAVRSFRSASPLVQAGSVQPGLLVWGRIENGLVILEPSFALAARPTAAGGSWTLEARNEQGAVVARQAFEPQVVADLPGDVRHFAMVVPMAEGVRGSLAELRVAGPGGQALLQRTAPPPGAVVRTEAAVERRAAGARVSWDARQHPAVLVRDPASGKVLGIGTTGTLELPAVTGEVELILSDGVRSTVRRERPR